ncbi:hypothetical protein MLD38_029336 [Melastoma candidum]|uniref:Uncharacterized protein n=1 Tax=Melastoma candidum TaxID=119954 RepID=A0ACB9N4A3_9MYRT|nr:hypothetical protein MLD38_029336 [Melastoma candidum]
MAEIRETPHKRHHKFVEFYDVRAAEAALRALNRSEIAGKRINLEPSRPGGARRNLLFLSLIQQLGQDLAPQLAVLLLVHGHSLQAPENIILCMLLANPQVVDLQFQEQAITCLV